MSCSTVSYTALISVHRSLLYSLLYICVIMVCVAWIFFHHDEQYSWVLLILFIRWVMIGSSSYFKWFIILLFTSTYGIFFVSKFIFRLFDMSIRFSVYFSRLIFFDWLILLRFLMNSVVVSIKEMNLLLWVFSLFRALYIVVQCIKLSFL